MRKQFGKSPTINAQPAEEMNARFSAASKGIIEGWASYDSEADFYIDKNRGWPLHYEYLEKIGIEPKIILTIRDPRAVLSSMEKLYRKNSLRLDPVLEAENAVPTTTQGRAAAWGGGAPVGVAANMVKGIFERKLQDKVLFIKFEDLTTAPGEQLKKIYEYLNYDEFFEYDLKNIQQNTLEDDRLHGIPNLHDIRPVLAPVESDWEDILGKDTSDAIIEGAEWFYKEFYPEVLG